MTSNHREKLDPALTRPGRVDRVLHFRNASREQMARLFTFFYNPIRRSSDATEAPIARFNLEDVLLLATRKPLPI